MNSPIDIAIDMAQFSSMKYRHGAVLICNREIISKACNRERTTRVQSERERECKGRNI